MTDDEQAVRAVIQRTIAAFQAGDADTIDALSSDRPGCITIGTDPDEWWDKAAAMALIRETVRDGGQTVGDMTVRTEPGEFTVHVQGDVAWTEGTGKFVNDRGAERALRNTAVFVREAGGWRSVQAHYSVGVPNQDIFNT